MRHLCKGNVAVVKGAVLAGCRAYYGYPITPASEIAEYAALYIPEVGGRGVPPPRIERSAARSSSHPMLRKRPAFSMRRGPCSGS